MKNLDLSKVHHIHLIGVGGSGMSGLAVLFQALGYQVSGCDLGESSYIHKAREGGAKIFIGHDLSHLDVGPVDLVAYSSAIAQDHPEIVEARRRGIPVVRRAELLSCLFNRKKGIGVAGTHGKTTTTSMLSAIFTEAGLKPTTAIGGIVASDGAYASLGEGDLMIAELDESDGTFLNFYPSAAVITNIDWDHVDHYPTFESVIESFTQFVSQIDFSGVLALCGDDLGVQRMMRGLDLSLRILTFGFDEKNQYHAQNMTYLQDGGMRYTLYCGKVKLGEVRLNVIGRHFVLDSLGAIALALDYGVSFEAICKALEKFGGAKRRLQRQGETSKGALVYDDYGHHPQEIKSTVEALRQSYPGRRMVMVFQPHRYTRTAALADDFACVLSKVDQVVLLPIYAASERPIEGVHSEMLCQKIKALGGSCVTVNDEGEAFNLLMAEQQSSDLIVTEGAGDVGNIGLLLLSVDRP